MFSVMTSSNSAGGLTLALIGRVSADVLPEIDRLVDDGRRRQGQVKLDLSEVTLIDRRAARFFAEQLGRGVELVDCPNYLRHWITREMIDDQQL
jgi:ABC-type transporter Mla MlaB component